MSEEEVLNILSKLGFAYKLEDADAEAIIKIQDLIEHIRFGTQMKYDIKSYIIAIEGLLDLYNKEKKEINRLQEENNELKEQLSYAVNTNNKDILEHWRKK